MKTSVPLLVTLEFCDKDGKKIGEKQVVAYAGLLAKAHDECLSSVDTQLLQVPSKDNGDTAIVRATVTTGRGAYSAIGDANPGNASRKMAPHLIRLAETRAKARALRDAVNIGLVSMDELGELTPEDADPPRSWASAALTPIADPRPSRAPERVPDSRPASEPQRRLLLRLAKAHGMDAAPLDAWLTKRFGPGTTLATLTGPQASRSISDLQKSDNGHGPPQGGAPN